MTNTRQVRLEEAVWKAIAEPDESLSATANRVIREALVARLTRDGDGVTSGNGDSSTSDEGTKPERSVGRTFSPARLERARRRQR